MAAVDVAVERRVIKDGVPALSKLTMWLWAWGCMMLLTLFCRAVFGTVEGVVGWVPFAGRLLKTPIHRIEQRVSHLIGGAVKPIDRHIATQWHSLAQIVRSIPSQLVDDAGLIFGLAAALVLLPSAALVKHLIRVATGPLKALLHQLARLVHAVGARTTVVEKTVAHNVYPRIKVIEHDVAHVIAHDIPYAGAQAKAAEDRAISTYKWLAKHKSVFLTGVFTGAVAWALTRLGGGWIRCANWRKFGKAICRMPMSALDALLAGLLAVIVLENIRVIAEYGEKVTEEIARDLSRLIGVGEFPDGRFTIE